MELHRLSENEQAFVECFSRFVNGQMGSAAKVGNALQMTIAILSTKRARWCLPSWNALPTTIKKVVMTSVTSGCADWQQRPSNTL